MRPVHEVRPEHQEFAMRHVENPHEPVLQIEPHRDERVDPARDEPRNDQLNPKPHRTRLTPETSAGSALRQAPPASSAGAHDQPERAGKANREATSKRAWER